MPPGPLEPSQISTVGKSQPVSTGLPYAVLLLGLLGPLVLCADPRGPSVSMKLYTLMFTTHPTPGVGTRGWGRMSAPTRPLQPLCPPGSSPQAADVPTPGL